MKLVKNIIQRTTDFGTLSSRENFFLFALKCLFYIIPAIILGNYTDIIMQRIKKEEHLGSYSLYYILIQTLIIISTLYIILLLLSGYERKFQDTLAGGFFSVLYFGIQTNYIYMIKDYINS